MPPRERPRKSSGEESSTADLFAEEERVHESGAKSGEESPEGTDEAASAKVAGGGDVTSVPEPGRKAPVVLVDGSAYLYRAFHVMERQGREMTTAAGVPTGTIYVVVNMLRKLAADYRPEIMVCVFDAKGKTFRDELYADYKATRSAMPDEMRAQVEPLHALIRAMGMPLLVVDGVEADDVIGTLSVAATAAGLETVVSTGDKDMAQLVDAHVTLVNTMSNTVMDVDGVKEKFGVRPDQIVDYLALVGDTSDNIPGIPSCGPKTAAKWLGAHGDIDTLVANADAIKGKIGEKLRDNLEQLSLSRTLTKIVTDVPLPEPLEKLTLAEPDRDALAALYDELEFHGWRRELDEGFLPLRTGSVRTSGAAADAPAPDGSGASGSNGDATERHYDTVLTMDALDAWIAELEAAELVAFDTETTSLDYMRAEIVGVSFATAPGRAAYVPLAHVHDVSRPEPVPDDPVVEKADAPDVDASTAPDGAGDSGANGKDADGKGVEGGGTAVGAAGGGDTSGGEAGVDESGAATSKDAASKTVAKKKPAARKKVAAKPVVPEPVWESIGQLDRDTVLERLRPWLEGDTRNIVGQHLKYDANVLARHGVALNNIAHDTMLESYVLDSTATRHNMDALALKHLGIRTVKFEDIAGKGRKQLTFDKVPLEAAAHYAAEDADITLRLHHALWPKLAEHPPLVELYTEMELPLVPVLARVERNGVRIDADMLAKQGRKLAESIEAAQAAAFADAGREFNLGSPKQIGEIFFDEKRYPVLAKTKTGQPSTAENVLEQLAADHELPKLILQHRSLTKLKSTYIDALPERIDPDTARVHTSYHQAVTSTGRLSSSEPNLQNIPVRTEEGRRIREAFVAADGYRLLAADYSQIELRIMAHLSGDPGLVSAFENGLDVHRATAAEVFGVALADVDDDQRRVAKTTNFGLIYGMSAFGLARQLGMARGEAQAFIDVYFARYPGVRTYMDDTRASARELGYVETVYGRRLYLPDIDARNGSLRQYAERTAINAPLQGTAADVIKRAMIAVDAWLREDDVDARIIMQVHDELVLEVRQGELERIGEAVRTRMREAASLRVPLEVDIGIGDSWEEAH